MPKISPARAAAWSLLCTLHEQPAADIPLPVLLHEAQQSFKLGKLDTALTMELTYGVLRAQSRLRALLAPFLRKPDALPQCLLFLLLQATYELLFLDHIPSHATLHQTVSMVRKRFGASLAGLTNAVLRAVDRSATTIRQQDALFLGQTAAEFDAPALARLGALPAWLAQDWVSSYGVNTAHDFARNAMFAPKPAYRMNLTDPGLEATRRSLLEAGATFPGSSPMSVMAGPAVGADCGPDLSVLTQLESEGRISRQGLGSQRVVEHIAALIQSEPALRQAPLWDACCGRGGKTCALLEQGLHVELASDPAAFRLLALRSSLERLHLRAPGIRSATVQAIAPEYPAYFPLILLDVPCSGSGTLARNPELRLRLNPQRVAEMVPLQAALLYASWSSLQPGGFLFYVTCALNTAENEMQVQGFAARTLGATILEQRLMLPEHPGQDALFLAVLRKN